jgi:hypothetical protein
VIVCEWYNVNEEKIPAAMLPARDGEMNAKWERAQPRRGIRDVSPLSGKVKENY